HFPPESSVMLFAPSPPRGSLGLCPWLRVRDVFTLKSMRARARRLEEFAKGLSQEVERVKGVEQTVLLPGERRQYLDPIQDVIVGAEAARRVVEKAVRRIETSPFKTGKESQTTGAHDGRCRPRRGRLRWSEGVAAWRQPAPGGSPSGSAMAAVGSAGWAA